MCASSAENVTHTRCVCFLIYKSVVAKHLTLLDLAYDSVNDKSCVSSAHSIHSSWVYMWEKQSRFVNEFLPRPFLPHSHKRSHTTHLHSFIARPHHPLELSDDKPVSGKPAYSPLGYKYSSCLRGPQSSTPHDSHIIDLFRETLKYTMVSLIDLPFDNTEHRRSHYLMLHCPHSSSIPIPIFYIHFLYVHLCAYIC